MPGGPDGGSRCRDGTPAVGPRIPRNLALVVVVPPPSLRGASHRFRRRTPRRRRGADATTARAGGWPVFRVSGVGDGRDWRSGARLRETGREITENRGILGRNSGARTRKNGAEMPAISVISHENAPSGGRGRPPGESGGEGGGKGQTEGAGRGAKAGSKARQKGRDEGEKRRQGGTTGEGIGMPGGTGELRCGSSHRTA